MASGAVCAVVLAGARAAGVAGSQAAAVGAARRSVHDTLKEHGLAPTNPEAPCNLPAADPALAAPRACEVANPQEASALADRLFEKGEYQHAGVCYQAAGDMVHANLAFLKAAAPQSEDTARALKTQRDVAKALFAKVGNTFHGGH